MSAHHHEQKVPRGVLLGASALMLFTIAIAAVGRSAHVAAADAPASTPVASVDLRFEDRPDGSVVVVDAHSDREIHVFEPRAHGFVRGVLRGMFRARRLESIGHEGAFRLHRESDGRLLLTDPQSGREVELRSFGPTNYQVFADLLDAASHAPRDEEHGT